MTVLDISNVFSFKNYYNTVHVLAAYFHVSFYTLSNVYTALCFTIRHKQAVYVSKCWKQICALKSSSRKFVVRRNQGTFDLVWVCVLCESGTIKIVVLNDCEAIAAICFFFFYYVEPTGWYVCYYSSQTYNWWLYTYLKIVLAYKRSIWNDRIILDWIMCKIKSFRYYSIKCKVISFASRFNIWIFIMIELTTLILWLFFLCSFIVNFLVTCISR